MDQDRGRRLMMDPNKQQWTMTVLESPDITPIIIGWGSSRSVALLSAPPEAQCAALGGPHPVAPHGVAVAGAFFLLDRGAVSIAGAEGGPLEGRWRGPGTRSAAATLDACRALLADHLSYGDRWGNPLFKRGGHPAVRLGWRLAAD
ncbi:unnamed protein product [Pleuronectes platessa]|uniref:Uncharacterized protein n=1 Tax=Pleuronectes platessa TaxID=8262 RepID=A0A9N7UK57_PLEPL|nr:unnamed protein product [Pleuronectes platessa]